jgi:hypothetical protein
LEARELFVPFQELLPAASYGARRIVLRGGDQHRALGAEAGKRGRALHDGRGSLGDHDCCVVTALTPEPEPLPVELEVVVGVEPEAVVAVEPEVPVVTVV